MPLFVKPDLDRAGLTYQCAVLQAPSTGHRAVRPPPAPKVMRAWPGRAGQLEVRWVALVEDAQAAHNPYFEALRVFSSTLNSTIRRIRSVGSGWPSGNCAEPFPLL